MGEESLNCSFCQKSRKNVTKMIVGATKVAICNECIKLCVEILDEDAIKVNIEKVKPLTTSEGSGVSSSFMNPSSLYDFDLLFDTFYNKISSYGYVESKILQYLKRENSIDANLMKAYSQTIAKSLQTEINSNEFIKLGGRSITFTLSFADKELLAKIIVQK